MNSIRFLRPLTIAAIGVAALCLFSTPAQTETFVSYSGRFHFNYPNTWVQLDYITAEFYLTRGDTTKQVDFEAVFCDQQTAVLFHDQYLIMTVDTIGALSAQQIDSVADGLAAEFKRPIKEVSSDAFLASTCRDSIVYDRSGSRFAVESEVPGDSSGSKVNLLVMKAYEHGIANYYFYSPASNYARNLPLYRDMVASFSTEPLPSAAAEPVKVADLETEPKTTRNYPLFFGGPLAIILIILAVRLRKKRQQATSAENKKG